MRKPSYSGWVEQSRVSDRGHLSVGGGDMEYHSMGASASFFHHPCNKMEQENECGRLNEGQFPILLQQLNLRSDTRWPYYDVFANVTYK